MGGMPPGMQQPGMQGMPGMPPQMMQPPMQRPPKQGTSKAVPVVVSAGLAVGVFCGLLFGLGTGKKEAAAEPVKMTSNGVEQKPDFVPESMARDPGKAEIPKKPAAGSATGSDGSGSAAVAAAGSDGSGSAAPAAAGSAGSGAAVTAATPPKLIVEITPDDAAKTATITVDTKPLTGTTLDVPFDPGQEKKTVHVEVKATGYKDTSQDVVMERADNTIKFEMAKAAPAHTTTAPTAASTFHPGGVTTHPATSTTGPVPTHTSTHSTHSTTPPKKKPTGGGIDI